MKKYIFLIGILFISFLVAPVAQSQTLKEKLNKIGKKKTKENKPAAYNLETDLLKIGGPFADKGMTGDIHEKYVGKIVFAKDKIPMKNTDESTFVNEFDISDNIYGRVYMPRSVENYPIYSTQFLKSGDTSTANHNKYGRFYYNLFIDGELDPYWNIELVDLSKNKLIQTTTYQIWVHPKPADQKVNDYWKDLMNNLSNGEHTIRIDAVAGSPSTYSAVEPIASGEFKLIKGEGASFSADYGKTFNDIESKMSNPTLEAEMLRVARDYAKVNNYKEDFQQVKIANSDWTIIHHELTGVVLRRIIDVNCLAKWPDGHCSNQKFVFGQEYVGGSFTNTVKFHGVTYGSYAENLNCE